MRSPFYIVSREDFEAWVALLDAKITVEPDSFKSLLRVEGKHANGTRFQVDVTGLYIVPGTVQTFYARGANGWNHVKITDSGRCIFNHYDTGARHPDTWKAADEAFALLTEGYHLFG